MQKRVHAGPASIHPHHILPGAPRALYTRAVRAPPATLLVATEVLQHRTLIEYRLGTKDRLHTALDVEHAGSAELLERLVIHLGGILHTHA